MSSAEIQQVQGPLVEEEIQLTLIELCQACRASEEHVMTWVFEGVLEPIGASPQDWRFAGPSLRRARLALWLTHDLDVNPPGIALALDLFDEIAELQARLERVGIR
jgi:chaperone modulatory protein CbpM